MNKKLLIGVLAALAVLGICTGGVRLVWRVKPMDEDEVLQYAPLLEFTEAEVLAADHILESAPIRQALETNADTELDWDAIAEELEEAKPGWTAAETVEIVGQNVVLDFRNQWERLILQYSIRDGNTVYLISKTYTPSPFVGETIYSAEYDCTQGEVRYEKRFSRRLWLPFLRLSE